MPVAARENNRFLDIAYAYYILFPAAAATVEAAATEKSAPAGNVACIL